MPFRVKEGGARISRSALRIAKCRLKRERDLRIGMPLHLTPPSSSDSEQQKAGGIAGTAITL
jgi:hypothetical protein